MSSYQGDEKVERMLYSLTALADIGEAITAGSSFETTIRELLHLILGTLTVSKGAILLHTPETSTLRLLVGRGVDTACPVIPFPSAVAKAFCENQQPVIFSQADHVFGSFVEHNHEALTKLHAYVWTPLIVGNRLLGILNLSEKFGKHPYTDDDLQMLNTIAHHTSIAIYNYQIIDELRATNFKLNRKVLEMESLYDVGLAISSLLDLAELSREILQRAVMLLDASRGVLFFTEGANLLRVAASFGMEDRYAEGALVDLRHVPAQLVEVALTGKCSCILNERSQSLSPEAQNRLIVPILIAQRVIGVLMVSDKETREGFAEFTDDDEQFLAAICNQAAIAIDNARLHKEALEKERIEKELEVAATIQQRLLPDAAPTLDGIELIGVNMSCRQVGGDYYDYIQFDNQQLGIAIADVSGKGTPAALLVSTLQASFHALLQNYDLTETVTRLNKAIFKASPSYNYITFFYGVIDLKTRSFCSINAGHNDTFLIDASGEVRRLSTGGFCLGMFDFATYEVEQTFLRPGDIIFLYTDGVTESNNLAGDEFGEETALELIITNRHLPMAELSNLLSEAIKEFVGEAPQHDDLTFVLVKVN